MDPLHWKQRLSPPIGLGKVDSGRFSIEEIRTHPSFPSFPELSLPPAQSPRFREFVFIRFPEELNYYYKSGVWEGERWKEMSRRDYKWFLKLLNPLSHQKFFFLSVSLNNSSFLLSA